MFTLPEIVTVPDALVRAPPDSVSVAAVRVLVAFANEPPATVRVPPTEMFEAAVTVPVVIVRLLNDWVMLMEALAPNDTVELPAVKVALAAVTVQLPFAVIVEPLALIVPKVPIVTEPAATAKFEVARMVAPDGLPAEFCTVKEVATTSPLVAMVYVGPAGPPESRTRL